MEKFGTYFDDKRDPDQVLLPLFLFCHEFIYSGEFVDLYILGRMIPPYLGVAFLSWVQKFRC
jgi:hypothetical protein